MIPLRSGAAHIGAVLDDWVGRGRIVGGVVLLSAGGTVVECAVSGWADRERRQPMRRDTVLRYASMTKLVTSVIALQLCETGLLALDAPVTDWLADFTPRLPDGACPPILIRHLLSHTAGLSYGFEQPPGNPYELAGISDGLDSPGIGRDENLARLGRTSLFSMPGSRWQYSLATDVLGAVIEQACGESLGHIAEKAVLGPLGMRDSGFPGHVLRPVAPGYWPDGPGVRRVSGTIWGQIDAGRARVSEDRAMRADAYASPGAGMIGTADDYLRLLHCLRAGGSPIISEAAVRQLTTSATGTLPIGDRGPGWAFGLGPVILTDPDLAQQRQGRGTWGWCGVHGGHYWVDPQNDLALVVLTNTGITGAWGAFADQLLEVIYA